MLRMTSPGRIDGSVRDPGGRRELTRRYRSRGLWQARAGLIMSIAAGVLLIATTASASAASPSVLAWGANQGGQLGDGATERSDVPVGVSGLSGVTAVSGGADFSLALLSDGTVMAWGENGFGELGDGSTEEKSDVPVAVSGLSEVTAIAAGGNHSLALLRNGTVVAWGEGSWGQLGN
jgi:alpha-tubulin suppressor-like RCC1 family protein